MSREYRRALFAVMLMLLGCAAAIAARPTKRLSAQTPGFSIAATIPERFGDWATEPTTAGVVNPQTQQLLKEIYSQVLSRTYRNQQTGERIMLSVAYGGDQSDANQIHIPDVCYPAQGFQVTAADRTVISTRWGNIPAKRLVTQMPGRPEPLTYWTTVGAHVAIGTMDRKLRQLAYEFHGEIPDGLILRVSSVTPDTTAAFAGQARFAADLVASLPPEARTRFAGL